MKNKHEFYLSLCSVIARQSYAQRNKVGALLEKNGNIIAFGYNGTPSGFDNKCEYEDLTGNVITKSEVLHAESNAIAKCASNGISSKGSTLYCTTSPCIECAKIIIQAGISCIVFKEKYRLEEGLDLLAKAGIEIINYDFK